jgi:thioredoxin reductase (NADPH)
MTVTDVAIIGAGPIGIELAVAMKRRGIEYLHFDAGQVGQTMYWWPPGTRWFSSNDRISIAGVPLQTVDQSKATREEYLRYLRTIVQQFDLSINTYEPVVGIEQKREGFVLSTRPADGPRIYHARQIVLATGGTAAPRMLGVPGENLPHVSHYMEDPHKYFRRRVLIVGGRNSAVEAALRCHQAGATVAISYRRPEFEARTIKYWLYPEIMGLIKSGAVEAHFSTIVAGIKPSEVALASCDASFSASTSDLRTVPADFVLLLVGYVADMSLARMAGVELNGPQEIPTFDPQTMQTNVPGVFIAGTTTGGTQDKYQVFLENCHIHVDRIIAAIMGEAPPPTPQLPAQPES